LHKGDWAKNRAYLAAPAVPDCSSVCIPKTQKVGAMIGKFRD